MTKDLFFKKKNEEVNHQNEALPKDTDTQANEEKESEGHINDGSEKEIMIPEQEYLRLKELEKKLEYQDPEQEQAPHQENIGNSNIIAQWERDAAQLKFIHPEFDFRTELRNNPQFRQLVSSGMGVIEAYASSRPAVQKQEPPKQAERKPIKQNAQSPDGGTGTNTRNPANMSSAEFKQYIDSIRNS